MCRHYCSKYFQNSRCSIKTTRFGVWLVPLFFEKKKTNYQSSVYRGGWRRGVEEQQRRRCCMSGGQWDREAAFRYGTARTWPIYGGYACVPATKFPPATGRYVHDPESRFRAKKWMCVEGDNSTHESYKPTYLQKGTYVPMRTNSSGWLGSLAYG